MKSNNQAITLQPSKQTITEIMRFYDDCKSESKNQYILFFAKTDQATISIYTTGKVMFQGDHAQQEAAIWQAHDHKSTSPPTIAQTDDKPKQAKSQTPPRNILPNTTFTAHAGSDEVGTGDYFGPVCVCACYISNEHYAAIRDLHIQDSKVMDDIKIRAIAPALMELLPHSLLVLSNNKYNEIHDSYNMNGIKAMLHNKAYVHLTKKLGQLPPLCVVDQFTPPQSYYRYISREETVVRSLHFETKAEAKFLAVACASVIARYAFLQAMDQLSDQVGMVLPKGAGAKVDEVARQLVAKHGKQVLHHVAKLHFANTSKLGL